jgi:hypothetical protein
MKKPYWIIQNPIDKSLYWSNEWGWGSKTGCFKTKTRKGMDLPFDEDHNHIWIAKWLRVKSSKN